MKNTFYLLGILSFGSLSSQAQSITAISLDSLKNATEIYLNKGQLLQVTAYSNPSTGYMWHVDYDKKSMELVKENYASDPAPAGWVGVGGQKQFTFKNKGTSKSTLYFTYSRGSVNSDVPSKKIHILSSELTKASLVGQWFQTQYTELVVRDGEEYPHEEIYKKGDHSFHFQSTDKGFVKFKNTETGQFEETPFHWSFKKQKLTINYIVDSNVQDPLPEVYNVTRTDQGLVLESIEKEDDSNYIYSKIILSN